jgi:hypothetical protein
MSANSLTDLFESALADLGEDRLKKELANLVSDESTSSEDTLTIVVNYGVHHIPNKLLRGEVFKASEGSLDFSSKKSIIDEFERVLKNVASKLKESEWKKIYLIPYGPANLSVLIKLLVYRVTHIETVDTFYLEGEYHEIDIQLRKLILEAE